MIKIVDENTSMLIVDLEYLLTFASFDNTIVSIPIFMSEELLEKKLIMSLSFFQICTNTLRGSYKTWLFYLHEGDDYTYLVRNNKLLDSECTNDIADNIILLNFSYKLLDFLHMNGIDIDKYNNIPNVIKDNILIPEINNKYISSIIKEIVINRYINNIELINFLSKVQF